MDQASAAIRQVLTVFTTKERVEDALLEFVAQLERDYAASEDIALFIFAIRSFFCWHRAPELVSDLRAVATIRDAWLAQNECIYAQWLSSMEDNPRALRWAKWTFQAKNSILDEFLKGQITEGRGPSLAPSAVQSVKGGSVASIR